jgi:uncharacterized protein YjbJ (UPF0337 family)
LRRPSSRNIYAQETIMNRDRIQGRWKELEGAVRAKWGELTDDELDQVRGDADRLAGLIQRKYGAARDAVEKQLDELAESLDG